MGPVIGLNGGTRPAEVYIGVTGAVVSLSVADRQVAVSLAANLPPRLEDPEYTRD